MLIKLSTLSQKLNSDEKVWLDLLGESVDVLLGQLDSTLVAGFEINESLYFAEYLVCVLLRYSDLDAQKIEKIEQEFLYCHLMLETMDSIGSVPDPTKYINELSVFRAERMNQYKDIFQSESPFSGLNTLNLSKLADTFLKNSVEDIQRIDRLRMELTLVIEDHCREHLKRQKLY